MHGVLFNLAIADIWYLILYPVALLVYSLKHSSLYLSGKIRVLYAKNHAGLIENIEIGKKSSKVVVWMLL